MLLTQIIKDPIQTDHTKQSLTCHTNNTFTKVLLTYTCTNYETETETYMICAIAHFLEIRFQYYERFNS